MIEIIAAVLIQLATLTLPDASTTQDVNGEGPKTTTTTTTTNGNPGGTGTWDDNG